VRIIVDLLRGNLPRVSPDEQNASAETDEDEGSIQAHVDVERVNVSRCPIVPE
jgi:hypothetical protein